jgi:F0F1-type ATP synthase beta subunit
VRCLLLDAHTPLHVGASVRNTGTATTTAASAAAVQQLVAALPHATGTPQLLETGIKAIDLFCPFVRGGIVSIVGDRRVGTQVLMEELLHNLASRPDPLALLAFAHVDDVAEIWYGYAPAAAGAVQTIYVPVAETRLGASDDALATCDAIVSHSSVLGKTLQIWPAIDPLTSTSRALDRAIVGGQHVAVVQAARDLLARYPADVPLASDAVPEATRAQKIRAFCSQPLFVAAPFTGRPGQYVPREAAVAGVRAILAGTYDHLPIEAFLYVGTVEQAAERAQAA